MLVVCSDGLTMSQMTLGTSSLCHLQAKGFSREVEEVLAVTKESLANDLEFKLTQYHAMQLPPICSLSDDINQV